MPRATTRTRLSVEPLEAREVPALGLDTAYGIGGIASNPVSTKFMSAAASAAASGDRLVIAGNVVGQNPFGLGGEMAVTRLTSAGAADPQFGGGDGLATFGFDMLHIPSAVAVLPDGKVLVAGAATPFEGAPWDVFVVRLNADGNRDTSFGTGGEIGLDFGGGDSIRRMVVQTDGKILLAGSTSPPPGANYDPFTIPPDRLVLERLTAGGALDATFGTAGRVLGVVEPGPWMTGGLAVQPDGKVLVGGSITPSFADQVSGTPVYTEMTVLRFNSNGTLDAAFGSAGQAATSYGSFQLAYAKDMALLSDGRIVVGGDVNYGQAVLAWFSPAGSLLSQEQEPGAGGGLQGISDLIAMPQGGVEVLGTSGYGLLGGAALEYHPAPGSATNILQLNPGPGFWPSGGLALGMGGKLFVTGLKTGSQFSSPTDDYGYPLIVARLADPGITESPTTYVSWTSPLEVPTGTLTLQADVIPLLGGGTVMDGTLTFREGSTVLGTVSLYSNPWTPWLDWVPPPTVTLPPGDHTITAEYSGTYQWSASLATATFHFGQSTSVPVATGLAVSNTSPAPGELISLTGTVTRTDGGTPPATGYVTFYDGVTVLGTGTVLFGGAACFSTSMTAGTHSLSAAYSGDIGFDPATSGPVQVNVGLATSDVTLTTSIAAPVVGQPTTLTATVHTTNPGATLGGSVTFSDGVTILGTGAVGLDGRATLSVILPLGPRTLRAVYSGDAATLGSNSAPLALTVGRAPTATGVTFATDQVAVGQPVTVTATVSLLSGSAFPVGTVEFREGTRVLGTVALDGRGQAKLELTNLSKAFHSITAVYAGCSTCVGSMSAAAVVAVGNLTPVTTSTRLTASASAPVFGQDQTLTATVAGGTGSPPTGQVNFYDGSTKIGTASLSGGAATLVVRLNLGAHKLKAVYAGTTGFTGSTSSLLSQTVAKAPTTITLSLAPDGVTVRAQVLPGFTGSPIGSVTFKAGSVELGTAPVNGTGLATFKLALLKGTSRITAVYGGCSCYLGSTSVLIAVTT